MPTLAPPRPRETETWKPALERGNEVRLARARVRRELKSGRRQLLEVFEDPAVQTMKLMDLLAFLPGNRVRWKPGHHLCRADAQALKIIRRAGMLAPERLQVRGLSSERRRQIAAAAATIPHLRDVAGIEVDKS